LVSAIPEFAEAARAESAARSALVTAVEPDAVATLEGPTAEAAVVSCAAFAVTFVGAAVAGRFVVGEVLTEPTAADAPGAACAALVAPMVDVGLEVSAGALSGARQESAASVRHSDAIAESGGEYGEDGCPMMTP